MFDEFDEEASKLADSINTIINDLESRLSKLGLYMMNSDVGIIADTNKVDHAQDYQVNINDLVSNPEAYSIYISSVFQISDICWSDRVINPERHKQDKEFRSIAPTEFEVTLESMKDELLNWHDEEGGGGAGGGED